MVAAATRANRIARRMDGLLQDHRMKKVWETRAREDGERACASPQRASALGRQTELLPRFYSPGEMGIVGQPRGLLHQRRGDRPVARAAGEHDPVTPWIRKRRTLRTTYP